MTNGQVGESSEWRAVAQLCSSIAASTRAEIVFLRSDYLPDTVRPLRAMEGRLTTDHGILPLRGKWVGHTTF